MDNINYDQLLVSQLRDILKKRGLETKGKRLELIERLSNNDKEIDRANSQITIRLWWHHDSYEIIKVPKDGVGSDIIDAIKKKYPHWKKITIFGGIHETKKEIDPAKNLFEQGITDESYVEYTFE
jgi:hypothetical protein